ncbi:MAG: hypothetical protein ACOY9D_03005 [Pseudomonadota bacterium]
MTPEEKAVLGYQSALTLITTQGQIIWSSFSGMLAAHAGIFVLAGTAPPLFPHFIPLVKVLAIAGLLLCIAWFLVLRRHCAYYRFWFAWARHYENKYFKPELQLATFGKTYGEGGTLEVSDHLPSLPPFGFMARFLKVEALMVFVVIVVAFLYLLVLFA